MQGLDVPRPGPEQVPNLMPEPSRAPVRTPMPLLPLPDRTVLVLRPNLPATILSAPTYSLHESGLKNLSRPKA